MAFHDEGRSPGSQVIVKPHLPSTLHTSGIIAVTHRSQLRGQPPSKPYGSSAFPLSLLAQDPHPLNQSYAATPTMERV